MGDAKPWQIILIVVGILGAGVSLWWFGLRGSDADRLMANSIVMVDVESGQLYEFQLKGRRGVMIPERHPESGKIALLPVEQDSSGNWVISDRSRATLQYVEVTNNAVDRTTWIATVKDQKPIRVKND